MTSRPPIGEPSLPRGLPEPARRDSTRRRALIVLGVLVAASALGVWLILRADAHHGSPQGRPAACVSAAKGTAPALAKIRIRVFNATARAGLASTVAAQLRARGYTVIAVGNDSGAVPGPAIMRYGAGGAPAAKALAGLIKGAVSRPVTRDGPEVDLILGNKFTQLAPAVPQKPAPTVAACPASATTVR